MAAILRLNTESKRYIYRYIYLVFVSFSAVFKWKTLLVTMNFALHVTQLEITKMLFSKGNLYLYMTKS